MKTSLSDIVERAFPIFLKKGYDRASMADLVKASQLSKGAFYYYFPDKASLFCACVDRFFSAYLPTAEDTQPNLRAYVSSLCEGYARGLSDASLLCDDSSAYLRFVLSVLPLRRTMLRDSFRACRTQLAALIRDSLPKTTEPEANLEAERIFALIEGTGIIAALEGDINPQSRFHNIVMGYLDIHLPPQ